MEDYGRNQRQVAGTAGRLYLSSPVILRYELRYRLLWRNTGDLPLGNNLAEAPMNIACQFCIGWGKVSAMISRTRA